MWTEKYRPEKLEEFKGKSKKVKQIKKWIENWDSKDKKKALLLYGKPGTGKTSIAKCLANEYDYELVETNASDVRTKNALKDNLEQAVKQRSFTGSKKLILIDEIDGLASSDRGGLNKMVKIIKESKFPVIVTANDSYARGLKKIKRYAKSIELGKVHTNSIAARLRDICEKEGLKYDNKAIKTIARNSGGDMRSAINDLESLASEGSKIDSNAIGKLDYRNTERKIFEALKMIFKTKKAETAKKATDDLDENYDTLLEWIRENIPKEYKKKEDLASAFHYISKADLFEGRIKKQNWNLLKYVYDFMTVGVGLAKREKYKGFTKYSYPTKIKKMGKSKSVRAKRDKISSKISKRLHQSKNEAVESMKYLKILLKDEKLRESLTRNFELEEKEVEFIENSS